jgi:hypothetical protein
MEINRPGRLKINTPRDKCIISDACKNRKITHSARLDE